VLLNIASPLKTEIPLSVVLDRVMFEPEVRETTDEPPEVEVLLVTAKNVPPPEVPSRPSLPSLPSFPAGPGTPTYWVMYVTVVVEIYTVELLFAYFGNDVSIPLNTPVVEVLADLFISPNATF
jgi:hypothetical protein